MNKKAKNSPLTNKMTATPEEKLNYVSGRELTITEARKLLPDNMKHLELNPREYKFLAVYCASNFDAIKACQLAGYVERTNAKYRAIAYSILQRQEITDAIKIYIDTIIQPYKDRLELEILNIYYKRAIYSISTFYDNSGNFLPLKDIPEEWKCCIDDVEYVKNGNTIQPKYKLPNRDLALQALYRFITGQNLTDTSVTLPDEAKKQMSEIYKQVMKASNAPKPKKIRTKTALKDEE